MYAEDTIFATVLRMRQSLCVFILHCSDSYRWTGSFHWRSCFAMLWLQTYCLLLYVFGCTKQVFGNADRLHISKLTSINGLNEVQKSSHSSSRQVLYCTRLEIFQHSKLFACAFAVMRLQFVTKRWIQPRIRVSVQGTVRTQDRPCKFCRSVMLLCICVFVRPGPRALVGGESDRLLPHLVAVMRLEFITKRWVQPRIRVKDGYSLG